jgi:hypothetical protein
MKSHFAVIELSATAAASVQNAIVSPEGNLLRPNSVKLEAFTVRLAWAFASAVLLLTVVSLLLVVAGYAGSAFTPDLQPKSVSSSLKR